eukprot:403372910
MNSIDLTLHDNKRQASGSGNEVLTQPSSLIGAPPLQQTNLPPQINQSNLLTNPVSAQIAIQPQLHLQESHKNINDMNFSYQDHSNYHETSFEPLQQLVHNQQAHQNQDLLINQQFNLNNQQLQELLGDDFHQVTKSPTHLNFLSKNNQKNLDSDITQKLQNDDDFVSNPCDIFEQSQEMKSVFEDTNAYIQQQLQEKKMYICNASENFDPPQSHVQNQIEEISKTDNQLQHSKQTEKRLTNTKNKKSVTIKKLSHVQKRLNQPLQNVVGSSITKKEKPLSSQSASKLQTPQESRKVFLIHKDYSKMNATNQSQLLQTQPQIQTQNAATQVVNNISVMQPGNNNKLNIVNHLNLNINAQSCNVKQESRVEEIQDQELQQANLVHLENPKNLDQKLIKDDQQKDMAAFKQTQQMENDLNQIDFVIVEDVIQALVKLIETKEELTLIEKLQIGTIIRCLQVSKQQLFEPENLEEMIDDFNEIQQKQLKDFRDAIVKIRIESYQEIADPNKRIILIFEILQKAKQNCEAMYGVSDVLRETLDQINIHFSDMIDKKTYDKKAFQNLFVIDLKSQFIGKKDFANIQHSIDMLSVLLQFAGMEVCLRQERM